MTRCPSYPLTPMTRKGPTALGCSFPPAAQSLARRHTNSPHEKWNMVLGESAAISRCLCYYCSRLSCPSRRTCAAFRNTSTRTPTAAT